MDLNQVVQHGIPHLQNHYTRWDSNLALLTQMFGSVLLRSLMALNIMST
jgi:hypothetical protein